MASRRKTPRGWGGGFCLPAATQHRRFSFRSARPPLALASLPALRAPVGREGKRPLLSPHLQRLGSRRGRVAVTDPRGQNGRHHRRSLHRHGWAGLTWAPSPLTQKNSALCCPGDGSAGASLSRQPVTSTPGAGAEFVRPRRWRARQSPSLRRRQQVMMVVLYLPTFSFLVIGSDLVLYQIVGSMRWALLTWWLSRVPENPRFQIGISLLSLEVHPGTCCM